jgi:hypothetical protein
MLTALCAIVVVTLAGCQPPPPGLPQIVRGTVERYLGAWQQSDWARVYRMEGRVPGDRPLLHQALTDSLAFFTVTEIRYSDSAAACAVTLRWHSGHRSTTETGEIYLVRHGVEWRVNDFKSF